MNEGKVVVYDDFSGGDWGIRKRTDIPKNMWKGINVQAYDDGSIGPRSAVENVTPTGLPGTAATRPTILLSRDGRVFYVVGASLYWTSSFGGAATAATGTLTGGASSSAAQLYTDQRLGRWWINRAGVGLDYMTSANALVAVTTPAAFRMIAVRGERMFGVAGRVIYYSAAGDYTSWPALNQIDLGEGSDIQMIYSSGDSLYIATEASLYVLQGTVGSSTTVRQIAATGVPTLWGNSVQMSGEPWRAAKLSDETIAWGNWSDGTATYGQTLSEYSIGTYGHAGIMEVAWFKGGSVKYTKHPDYMSTQFGLALSSQSYEVFHAAAGPSLVLFPMGFRVANNNPISWMRVDPSGYSERHETAVGSNTFGPNTTPVRSIFGPQNAWDYGATGGPRYVCWCTWDGSAYKFWRWKVTPGPPNYSSSTSVPADATTGATYSCQFMTAPFYTGDGSIMKVRSVIVHGEFFNNTSGSNLSIVPRVFGVEGKSDSATSALNPESTQTVDLAATYATGIQSNPDRYVHRFRFGNMPFGTGFALQIGMSQCSISRIVVNYDVRPGYE